MLTVLDLFSGIGGFSLGLERTGGFQTVQFCEINPFCRKVLAKNFPGIPIHDDIRTFKPTYADIVVGGFPCQDISFAGRGAGLAGARSGLWSEMLRIIREVRPRYAIVENVAALLNRGISNVVADLAALGLDSEWHCIPACAVGAPHRRDRVWIVAYPNCARRAQPQRSAKVQECARIGAIERTSLGYADSTRELQSQRRECDERGRASWWSIEPDMGRVAYGVPRRVDRLRSLGNAVVPQIVEILGREILKYEQAA